MPHRLRAHSLCSAAPARCRAAARTVWPLLRAGRALQAPGDDRAGAAQSNCCRKRWVQLRQARLQLAPAGVVAAAEAHHTVCGAVELHDVSSARSLVQSVHILRYQSPHAAGALHRRQRVVRAVGPRLLGEGGPPGEGASPVALARRVARHEILVRDWPEAGAVGAAGRAVVRHAALGADAGAGEDEKPRRVRNELCERCDLRGAWRRRVGHRASTRAARCGGGWRKARGRRRRARVGGGAIRRPAHADRRSSSGRRIADAAVRAAALRSVGDTSPRAAGAIRRDSCVRLQRCCAMRHRRGQPAGPLPRSALRELRVQCRGTHARVA
jgi:hypothetical protein